MRPVLRLIERSGPSHANVLISGEPGTGKSLVARALHEASARSSRPLLAIIAGGQGDEAFDIQLFGADAPAGEGLADRAGVFELADGGTLLIDEAANLPADAQGRLLAALESGTRAGCGRARRAECGFWRQRARRWAPRRRPDASAASCCCGSEPSRSPARDFDNGAMTALVRHPWPGNVRELRHAIASAVRVARRPVLTARDLGLRAWGERSPRLEDLTLAEAEAVLIRRALARAHADRRWAAAALGLSDFDFRQRARRHGLA